MIARRGLTLIEVLAAAVLLAAMAATILPLVRDASASLAPRQPSLALHELAHLADAILEDPQAFGLGSNDLESHDLDRLVAWPDRPARPPVRVRANGRDADATHHWVVFEREGIATARWRPLARHSPDRAPPPGDRP